MNLEAIETKTNTDELYKILGQEAIMEFYFGDKIDLRKKYVNPFRNDSKPGCHFKWSQTGNLYFYDYATERVFYTALDIAMLATGYGYPDILYKIESDFQIKHLDYSNRKKLLLEAKEQVIPEVKPATIKVKVTKFSQLDLNYWGQFGITPSILRFFDVRRVDKAWINDELWYIDNDHDPCYRYKEKDRFKLYRPLSKTKTKWRSTYFGGILEGYTQLPHKGTQLIITKGLKDVMMFHSLGINAVAVRSENTPMSKNAFELLKNRFDRLFLWFDADEAGIIGCKKMQDMYNIPCVYHDPVWGKDPSDIYKNHGKEKLLELCKQLEIL